MFTNAWTRFLFSFSIKLLIRFGLASSSLSDMIRAASSVSLTLFMSYSTYRDIDGEITNILSSKCLPQSLLWQVGFHCSLLWVAANCANQSRFGILKAYSFYSQTQLHKYMWHSTPFYSFNEATIEHRLNKATCSFCLANMTSHSEVFRILLITVVAMWDVSRVSYKTTVTLFLGKKFNISDWNWF